MEKLKPCPFCGADLVIVNTANITMEFNGKTIEMAPQKVFLHPPTKCLLDGHNIDDRNSVEKEQWNRRADDGSNFTDTR